MASLSVRQVGGDWAKVSGEGGAREGVRSEAEKDVVEERERDEACSKELSYDTLMVAILRNKQVQE